MCKNLQLKRVVFVVCVCVSVLLATGCSREAKRAKFLKRAEAHFQAGDYDRAEIEYLNLLRLEPTNHVALRRMGLMSFEQGRTLRAYALLSQARKANPEDLEIRSKLAQVLLSGGKPKEARDEAVLLLARQPTNENALLLLVDSSLTTNELNDAQQRLTSLKSVSGQVPGYHVAWATVQLRHRDVKAAEASVRQALTLDPKSCLAHGAMANLHFINHDPTNALAEFKAAADLAPPRSVHRLRYVDFKVALGELDSAKELLGQIVKQTPDYLPASLRLAQIALGERRFPDCERVLKSVLARDPVHLEAMLLLARLHVAQNQPDQAVAALERALKIFPRLPQIHYQLAVANLMQNDLAGASQRLNQALALQPDYPEVTLLLAELNVRRGDTTQAISALTRLVERRPDLTPAQLLLANAYRARGNLAEALKVYQGLNQRFPTNPEPFMLSGIILEQQKRYADARKSYERAVSFSPNYAGALERLVDLDMVENNFTGAQERIQAEIARHPKAALPRVVLAKVFAAQTNFPAAEAALQQAIEFEPDYRPAHLLLARVYVAANKQPDALRKYGELVARNTNDISSWLQLADLHSAASNHVAAKDAYESILAVNPKFGAALNNLAWLYLEHLDNPKRALELATRAHDELPNHPSTSDTFGWVLFRREDYPRALAILQESARALPHEPEVQFHLGMAHYMMGEEAPARVALQNALQLGAADAAWKRLAQESLRVLDFDPATTDAAAISGLESLATRSPRDPVLLARLGAVASRQGAWARAASHYEKALQLNTNLVPVMVQLAQLYSAHPKDPARAFVLARRARSLEPSDPQIAHTLGRLAYDSAQSAPDFQWAYGLLQESARTAPDNVEWQFDFALVAYANGEVTAAVSAMEKIVAVNPASPHQAEAAQFLELNRLAASPPEATAAAARVAALLAKQPDYVPAMVVTGTIQESRGDFAAARGTFESVLQRFPSFAPANKALARLYATRLQNVQKAYEHANRAREAMPRDLEVARLLGGLAFQRGEYPRAIQLLTESAPAGAQDAELFFDLGLAHYKLKQSRESKAALGKALALAPNAPRAAEAKRVLAELK